MTSPDLGPVVIGLREVYDAVLRLQGAVERLSDHHEVVRAELADHERRIRDMEGGRWPLPSLAALVSIISLIIAAVAITRH